MAPYLLIGYMAIFKAFSTIPRKSEVICKYNLKYKTANWCIDLLRDLSDTIIIDKASETLFEALILFKHNISKAPRRNQDNCRLPILNYWGHVPQQLPRVYAYAYGS